MRLRSREASDALLGGVAGIAALVLGATGGALEPGWPSPSDPEAVVRFLGAHRAQLLAQSMLFVLSAAAFLWFLATLRSMIARSDHDGSALATVAFGSGATWVGMQLVAQAFQIGHAMSPDPADPALLATMTAVFALANLPLASMLGAVAVAVFRRHTFPAWLGWLSIASGCAEALLFVSAFATHGPLAPNGWLTYALYPAFAIWLLPASILLLRHHDAERLAIEAHWIRGGASFAGRGSMPWR